MSSTTTNYNLHKIDLADSPPDITVLNQNWDTIDEELKKKYDADNKPTASDVEAVAFPRTAVTGSLAEFCKNLKVYDSGVIGYYNVSDSPSGMAVGYLVYSKHNTIGSSVHCVAFYMGNVRSGYYDAASDKMIWGKGFDDYLPLTGGTLIGNDLFLCNKHGKVTNDSTQTMLMAFDDPNNQSGDRRSISVHDHTARVNIERAIQFRDVTNGTSTEHLIYGEHNKPSGTYTGNGSSTTRTIDTGGIGDTIMINSGNGFAIVTPRGAVCIMGTDVYGLVSDNAKFEDGVLTLNTAEVTLNKNPGNYYYQVL